MPALDILEPQNLMGLYERFAAEQQLPLQPLFAARASETDGPTISWDIVEYGQEIAALNTRDGQPNPVAPVVRGVVTARCPTIAEQVTIPAQVLRDLRAPGSLTNANGEAWISRNTAALNRRLERRIEVFRAQALGLDATKPGYLRFRLPGMADETLVDLGFASAHKTMHSASWATASTDIIGDIEKAVALIEENSGVTPDTMIVGANVLGYLRKNTGILATITDVEKRAVLQTGRLEQLLGLAIIPARLRYRDDAGSMAYYVPANAVCICAAASMNRALFECAPASVWAPEGTRGLFIHRVEGNGIHDGVTVQYTWTGLPAVIAPDELVADVNVTAA